MPAPQVTEQGPQGCATHSVPPPPPLLAACSAAAASPHRRATPVGKTSPNREPELLLLLLLLCWVLSASTRRRPQRVLRGSEAAASGRRTGAGGQTPSSHLRPLGLRLEAGAFGHGDRHGGRQFLPTCKPPLLHAAAAVTAGGTTGSPGAGAPSSRTRTAVAAERLGDGPRIGGAPLIRHHLA